MGQKNVHKVFKTGGVYEDTFFSADIKASEAALKILDAFAEHAKPFRARINLPAVWQYLVGSSKAGQKVLVEPHIANFRKFNSNTGKADNHACHEVTPDLCQRVFHQAHVAATNDQLGCFKK